MGSNNLQRMFNSNFYSYDIWWELAFLTTIIDFYGETFQ